MKFSAWRFATFCGALNLLLVLTVCAANATTYRLTELAPLPGNTESHALGLNDAGVVVGNSQHAPVIDCGSGSCAPPPNVYQATIWNGGTPSALNNLSGGTQSEAFGINNTGTAVGYSNTTGHFGQPVVWNGTTPTPLGTAGGTSGVASGINNSSVAAGYLDTNGTHATVWNGGTPTVLSNLPAANSSVGLAINNSGVAAGYTTSGSAAVATVWNGTTPTALAPLSGQTSAVANGINDAGVVVGWSDLHAVVWNGTTPTALSLLVPNPNFTSTAQDINNAGVIVGQSAGHATMWVGGVIFDLNDLIDVSGAGWVLLIAAAINETGQIVGSAVNPLGQSVGFLLTPNVPLPATLPLFATGLGALGLLGWRRKRSAV